MVGLLRVPVGGPIIGGLSVYEVFFKRPIGGRKIGEDNPKGTRDPLRQWWWVSGMHRGLPVDYLDTYNNNDSDGGDEDDLRFCRIGLDPRKS